jgi:hypothetical protein
MGESLRLKALDADDVAVIGAALQDAAVPVTDMRFLADERRFALAVSRFRWERPALADEGGGERVPAALTIEGVKAARYRGIDRRNPSLVLDLLTVRAGDGAVELVFAGEAAIRLEVERIEVRLEDFGQPWPTPFRPRHRLDDA